ncbi:MAG: TIGR04066 family peptide maturation system protein [Clostridiales Family XIII bacterium]|jgi:peptide maturation system protein (TIGR04066 family)|nr:TIGR04066 family peptide maturation system protein [Clostridiales Family XIII bacterium]
MENLLMYPFNKSFMPYVRHQDMLNDMHITSLISPNGWGLVGDKINTPCGDIIVSDDFDYALESCTCVWFIEDDIIALPKDILWTKLRAAITHGKNIVYTRCRDREEVQEMVALIPSGLDITPQCIGHNKLLDSKKVLYDIDTPTIFVIGNAECSDKFEVQLSLRKQFVNMGYKVSSVSTRWDSAIIGVHPFPEFMWDVRLSEEDKVYRYNGYIKEIEMMESPEIFIVGIPGGIVPYSRKQLNHFGITAYEIAMAIKCDSAVFCSLYSNYLSEYFDEISKLILSRFEIAIDYHHISAYMNCPDHQRVVDQEYNILTLDSAIVDEKIRALGRNDVFNLLSSGNARIVAEKIIRQFEGYGDIDAI